MECLIPKAGELSSVVAQATMPPKALLAPQCKPMEGEVVLNDGSSVKWSLDDQKRLRIGTNSQRMTVRLAKSESEVDAQRVAEWKLGLIAARSAGELG